MNAQVKTQGQQQKDDHQPGEKWAFDADVAAKFDNMLGRSIPGYGQMRDLCFDLGKTFLTDPQPTVIDLGSSRGESVSAFVESRDLVANYILTEVSEPMLDQIRERWGDRDNVFPINYDLRKRASYLARDLGEPQMMLLTHRTPEYAGRTELTLPSLRAPQLIQAILTLIFVPINWRQSIIQGVHDALAPGGAFIMVEKVLGNTALTQDLLVDSYHEHKNRHGYSWEDIERKRASLEGVQVPVRSEENLAMLRNAGFRHVEVFWRHLNFEATIAIKDR